MLGREELYRNTVSFSIDQFQEIPAPYSLQGACQEAWRSGSVQLHNLLSKFYQIYKAICTLSSTRLSRGIYCAFQSFQFSFPFSLLFHFVPHCLSFFFQHYSPPPPSQSSLQNIYPWDYLDSLKNLRALGLIRSLFLQKYFFHALIDRTSIPCLEKMSCRFFFVLK